MKGALRLTTRNAELFLMPQKAIFWPEKQMLLVADTHFGKVTHFRKAGIAVPQGAAAKNLVKFEHLLRVTRAKEVYFLGDLFHSELNTEWFALKTLIQKFDHCQFHLVMGNHDILFTESYAKMGLAVHKTEVIIDQFTLTHEPMVNQSADRLNICGHIHPGVKLLGAAKQSLRFPCFYLSNNQLLLPAFGEFTGLHILKPKKHERVFVCTDEEVLDIF